MRLASGLLASALSLSLGIFACTRFGAANDPVQETDAGTDADANADPVDAGGFVIADNLSGTTEIVADDDHVVWNANDGVRAAPPVAGAAPVVVSEHLATSLQLSPDGERVVFASGDAVYYAAVDGTMAPGGRPITPQGTSTPVLGLRDFDNAISFAKDTRLYWCIKNGGDGCGNNQPSELVLADAAGATSFGGERNGTNLWLAVGDDLRSFESSTFKEKLHFSAEGGVRAFAIDELSAFYAPNTGSVILAGDKTRPSDPPTTFATIGTGHPYAMAVDATYVFVAVLETGAILKVNKLTKQVTPIAQNLTEPRWLAQTSKRLLVLSNGKILSYDKGE